MIDFIPIDWFDNNYGKAKNNGVSFVDFQEVSEVEQSTSHVAGQTAASPDPMVAQKDEEKSLVRFSSVNKTTVL